MFAALRRGAESTVVEWVDIEAVDGLESTEIARWVAAQTDELFERADDGLTMVIGKSLGSYVAATAERLSLPAIWVTPLLHDSAVLGALSRSTAPFMLVGGTADPHWDGAEARRFTPHVLEFDDADHGLFVPGPLALSAQNISVLATATERFLDELERSAGES
jgi:pimeloyl-ACP methyl ester carboxylesterase